MSQDDCMECGQCVAVCPEQAIVADGLLTSLGFSSFTESLEAIKPGQTDCDELVRLMRSRRSCRNYRKTPVPLELLEDLVRVGTTAPSGTNAQPWNFIVLPTRGDVEVLGNLTANFYRDLNRMAANPLYRFLGKLAAKDALGRYYRKHFKSVEKALHEWDDGGIDRLFHGATAAILVTGKKGASCPAEDSLLATQNILLAAHALGLGACLIGFVVEAIRRTPKIRRCMAIPAEEEIYSVIGLGYPAVTYTRVAGRRPVSPRVLHLT